MFKDKRIRSGMLLGMVFILLSFNGMIANLKNNKLYDVAQINIIQQYKSYNSIVPTYYEDLKLFISVEQYPNDTLVVPPQLKEKEGKIISFSKTKTFAKQSEVFTVFVDKNNFSYTRFDKGLYGKD